MKNLILSLLGLLCLNFAFSQETLSGGDGGQNPSNQNVKLDYMGAGNVKVTNPRYCDSKFRLVIKSGNQNVKDTTFWVGGNNYKIIVLPSGLTGNITVKAKYDYSPCTFANLGWVELVIALPLKFVNFGTERISDTEFYVNFEIAEVVNVKEIYIKVSLDGKVYKVFTTLKPNQTKYHEKIDLKEFVKTGKTPAETKQ